MSRRRRAIEADVVGAEATGFVHFARNFHQKSRFMKFFASFYWFNFWQPTDLVTVKVKCTTIVLYTYTLGWWITKNSAYLMIFQISVGISAFVLYCEKSSTLIIQKKWKNNFFILPSILAVYRNLLLMLQHLFPKSKS